MEAQQKGGALQLTICSSSGSTVRCQVARLPGQTATRNAEAHANHAVRESVKAVEPQAKAGQHKQRAGQGRAGQGRQQGESKDGEDGARGYRG
eukprot:SAG22_NODE_12601_length_436_cov_1.094955_1_plen_92_part_01